MINNIDIILKALTAFPDRPNYTSSSAYGAAVAKWLKENKELSETLAVLIPELNTMINQINSTVEGLNTIDEDVIQNKEDIEAIAVAVEVLKDETILIKNLAEKWANENENVVVENGKYSSMHWALKAYAAVATLPEGTLLDTLIALDKTWSSHKIKEELDSTNQIKKPMIIEPLNNTTNFLGSIEASEYQANSNYKGVLDYVHFQLSEDETFATIADEKDDNLSLSYTPVLDPSTTYYARVRFGSDNHLSSFSDAVKFTTADAVIYTPSIVSPIHNATEIGKKATIESSNYDTYGHSETQLSSSWQISTDIGFTTIVSESIDNATDLTSWTSGNLETSTTYYARVKYKSTSYESNWSSAISFTTKAQFTIPSPAQGSWGFGIAPTDEPFAALGLAELTGTNTYGHANYGNYIHTNGSITCWHPKTFYRVGHPDSPRYAVYGANALDFVGTETFENETEANAAGYILDRVFINNSAEKSGFFMDKYKNSKDGTTAGKSVFGGNPVGMTSNASYNPSSAMAGCTGIIADAITLSRARGARWNTATAFMYGYKFMTSIAHGQAVTDVADCAWYDGTLTTNFPKGCNNNALSDVNDTSVTYTSAGDGNANKPKTGATANFNKTTCNGCANGVADLNGGMFEYAMGVTNFGTSATATTVISGNTIYALKESVDHASLTAGWDGNTDAFGNTTKLSLNYDAVTSPSTLTGTVYWGNGANAIFSNEQSGVARDLNGFIPKNDSATNATGTNMAGLDQVNKYNIQNMAVLACGSRNSSASTGLGYRNFYSYRSSDSTACSFRASAYFA